MNKHFASILLFVFLAKAYGTLYLYKLGLINVDTWVLAHDLGNCILFCGFWYLLKDKVNTFIHSLGMAIFVSRLITQVCSNDYECWYEMLSVITVTIIIYSIKKIWYF